MNHIDNYEADGDLMKALSKITGLSVPNKMTPLQKKKFVEDAIVHLRKKDPVKLDTVDDSTADAFMKLAGVNYDSHPLSKEGQKRKTMQDALNWIRSNDPVLD